MGGVKEQWLNNIPSDESLEEYYQDYITTHKWGFRHGKETKDVQRVCGKVYDSRGNISVRQ